MKEYKQCAAVLVFNDKGELALQLRAAHDHSFPSHWDFSVGGGVNVGEDEKVAAKREMKEEIGIDVEVEFLTKEHFVYPAWDPRVEGEIDIFFYRTRHNGPFNPDPSEVDRAEFFTLEKIKEMIESGEKFHPEFVLAWNKGIISNS